MMIEAISPVSLLLAVAVVLPFLPLPWRRAATVAAPLSGLMALAVLPTGEYGTTEFLGVRLILLRVDSLSLLFGLIFLLSATLASLYGWHRTLASEQATSLLYVGGGLAVVFAGDLVTMFIAWEIMAVASTFLILAGRKATSPAAGQRYLMVHLAAGSALLLGILLIVRADGSLAFGQLWDHGVASWLVLLALCVNAAVPPLHAWLPDAYPESSVSGSVFLSAFTTKAAVYCLIRGFPGSEVLVWGGVAMALYGVVFAVLENDMRRLLAYHIVSQVGYMVCGVGIGTGLALNGAAAHAFCHILYKALLFMGAGAVVYVTSKDKLSDLGGIARMMPITLVLYMVGGFSISGVPLFNGFISKSLIVTAAAEDGRGIVALLLNLASVGTFLHTGLKLPYFAWFGGARPRGAQEPPSSMLAAMAITASLCVGLGVAPGWLYAHLPFPPVSYEPYTSTHVFEMLLLLSFTALAFWWLLDQIRPHRTITLDTDWAYRRAAALLPEAISIPFERACARLGAAVADAAGRVAEFSRNPPMALQRLLKGGPGSSEPFDEDRQRAPIGATLFWTLAVFVFLGLFFQIWAG
jgi:multicomponent Na+:H+ antiporter subunit D